MVQFAYRHRELTSYPKINHVTVSSKAVFTAWALSSQYQAAITLCKQSCVDTQNIIKIHNIEINPLEINLDVSVCSGANNKAQIKVKTHRPPCRFSLLSIQWYAISGFDDRRWQWLSGRVLDGKPRGHRFEPHRHHCVVVTDLEQDTFILA